VNYSVVILSKDAGNLVPCVRSILEMEPVLARERIIVVDDGARNEAESELPGVRWVTGAKPFNFARNANLGVMHADESSVILLNDDTRLLTPYGFTRLSQIVTANPEYGIVSAAITGAVGNTRQEPQNAESIREEDRTVCFIAAYITRRVFNEVGMLDERFTDYGFDDDDMCLRARLAWFRLGIFDGCIVEHGVLPSTFRSSGPRPLDYNMRLFESKWNMTNWGKPL
jgi:GT2 family glycosyltransferase